jgi:hypothetical protein
MLPADTAASLLTLLTPTAAVATLLDDMPLSLD